MGLEKVHQLSYKRRYELRIDLIYKNTSFFAQYASFKLFGEPENYRLEIDGYSGDAGDSLLMLSSNNHNHNHMEFTTFDRDHDLLDHENCALKYHGGWWFNKCHTGYLNGVWGSKAYGLGLQWRTLTGSKDSVTFSEMKIRPLH